MSNFVRAHSETTRGPSPAIWGDLAGWEAKHRMGDAFLIFDDFLVWNTSTTNSTSYQGPWTVVADDGPVLEMLDDPDPVGYGEFGVLRLSGADADNDELYLTNSVTGTTFDIDDTTRKICFEIRMKKETVADAALTFFAGLASVGAAVAGTLAANAGTLIATKSFIGFSQDDGNGDGVNLVAQKASQTQQNLGADKATLTADTWTKLGFVYDPKSDTTDCLRWYQDGDLISGYTALAFSELDDTDFPNDVGMALLVGFLHEGTADEKAQIDWICAGQEV